MLLVREYPTPENEVSRDAEVRKYGPANENLKNAFDITTQLCASLLDTEISLISFIEDDNQIVRGSTGFSFTTISRSYSFCSHTILSNDVMVVLNAAEDLRFRRNQFVTASPSIRFYAGAPIKTLAGFNIGSLCVADPKPRASLSLDSRRLLSQLAKVISSQLDEVISGPINRTEPRHSVNLGGMISSYGKRPAPVAIQNISTRGAMIYVGELIIPKGEEVVLSVGTAAMVATVMWATNSLVGLSFHRAIVESSLISMQKAGRKFTKSQMC